MSYSFSIGAFIVTVVTIGLIVLFFVSLFLFVRKILRNSDARVQKLSAIEEKLDYLIHQLNNRK